MLTWKSILHNRSGLGTLNLLLAFGTKLALPLWPCVTVVKPSGNWNTGTRSRDSSPHAVDMSRVTAGPWHLMLTLPMFWASARVKLCNALATADWTMLLVLAALMNHWGPYLSTSVAVFGSTVGDGSLMKRNMPCLRGICWAQTSDPSGGQDSGRIPLGFQLWARSNKNLCDRPPWTSCWKQDRRLSSWVWGILWQISPRWLPWVSALLLSIKVIHLAKISCITGSILKDSLGLQLFYFPRTGISSALIPLLSLHFTDFRLQKKRSGKELYYCVLYTVLALY